MATTAHARLAFRTSTAAHPSIGLAMPSSDPTLATAAKHTPSAKRPTRLSSSGWAWSSRVQSGSSMRANSNSRVLGALLVTSVATTWSTPEAKLVRTTDAPFAVQEVW